MLKRILAALLIGALSLFPDIVSAPQKALAQSSPFASVSAGPTTLSASGALTLGNLGYYSSCAVSVQGTFTATITPQVTQDGTNWITAPGASAIVAPTTTNYAISSFNAFRLNVTWVSGTSVTLSMTCSTASLSAGGTAAVVSVSNTPGVTVQNTPAVVFPSAQPVTVASSVPIVFPSAQPVTIASNAPVVFPTPQPVFISPASGSNGLAAPSPIPSVAASPTNVTVASGGHVLYGLGVLNAQATPAPIYVQIYNIAAAAVTPGTSVPVWEMFCPAGFSSSIAQTCYFPIPPIGVSLPNSGGFSVGATTTSVFTGGSTAPAAGVTVFPVYK